MWFKLLVDYWLRLLAKLCLVFFLSIFPQNSVLTKTLFSSAIFQVAIVKQTRWLTWQFFRLLACWRLVEISLWCLSWKSWWFCFGLNPRPNKYQALTVKPLPARFVLGKISFVNISEWLSELWGLDATSFRASLCVGYFWFRLKNENAGRSRKLTTE